MVQGLLLAMLISQAPVPERVEVIRDLEYKKTPQRVLHLDLYLPKDRKGPVPVIVWLHGGGWYRSDKSNTAAPAMVEHGFAVASINYRLSPQARFPAQIQDCKSAVRWLRVNGKKYGLATERIGAWGSSSGGHLAALMGSSGGVKELSDPSDPPNVSDRVQAVCDVAGPIDLLRMDEGGIAGYQPRNHEMSSPEAQLLGGLPKDRKELARLANPITHLDPEDPPFLIIHGREDEVVPVFQAELLAQALQKAHVTSEVHLLPGRGHKVNRIRFEEHIPVAAAFFKRFLLG